MQYQRRHRRLVALATVLCSLGGLGLAACGGGAATTAHVNGHTVKVTAGDQSLCASVSQAETAYQAKDYSQWRHDMAQISKMAGTANDPQLKKYAAQARRVNHRPREAVYNFAGIGSFVGLRSTCKSLGQ